MQNNIKKHLTAQNMTAAELERRTGIPHAVVNILHGRSKNPSLKTVQAIAKELNCSVEDLLAEDIVAVTAQAKTKQTWNAELYQQVFLAVMQCVQQLSLQPNPQQMANWLTEVYEYALGSPEQKVEQRFVQWLLGKE